MSDEARIVELPVKKLFAQDDVYDEFVVEKNRAKLIHRLIANQQGEIVPLQQEFVEDLGDVDIQLFEGDNYIYLYSLINDGAIYEIDYTICCADKKEEKQEVSFVYKIHYSVHVL